MNFDDILTGVEDAEQTSRLFDRMLNRLAKLLVGRLRRIEGYGVLKALKRELQDYNAATETWKP